MQDGGLPSENIADCIIDYFDRVDQFVYPIPPEILEYLKAKSTLSIPDRTIASLYRLGVLQTITATVFTVGEIDKTYHQEIGFSAVSLFLEDFSYIDKINVGRDFGIRMMEARGKFMLRFQQEFDKLTSLDVALELLLETYIHQFGSLVAAKGDQLWLELKGLDELFDYCLDNEVNIIMVSEDSIWDADDETGIGYGVYTVSDDGTVGFFLYQEREGESLEGELTGIDDPPILFFKAKFV